MTKFYLHDTISGLPSGTLPSSEQSTLTADATFEGSSSTNRLMDTTIGTAQASLVNESINTTAARNYYVTRWVTPVIFQTSIAANTWTYNFAASESANHANFPVSGSDQPIHVHCYVWKPSDGTKVGTILDGDSAPEFDEAGGVNSERVNHGTFSGSAVSGLTSGDAVIVLEMWFVVTQAMAAAYTQTIYYDGTTEETIENTTVDDHASFLETPEDLALSLPPDLVSQTSIHEYNILNNIVQTNIHKYNISQFITQTNIHKYDIVETLESVLQTSIHKYHLFQNVLQSSVHKYNIFQTILQTSIQKYNVLENILSNNIHKYNILENIIQQSIHKYNLFQEVLQASIHKYNMLQNVIQTSIQKYDLFENILSTSTHIYDIVVEGLIQATNKMKYNILQNVTQTNTHKYNILNNIIQTTIHKYHSFQNILSETLHKYNLFQNITSENIHKYDLFNNVTSSIISKYHSFQDVLSESIHKYNITVENFVQSINTMKYNIIQNITTTNTHLYDIFKNILATSKHKYQLGEIITIPLEDIDIGALGPDRTNKNITLRCLIPGGTLNIKNDQTGTVFDVEAPVSIECFVRDITATAKRREPPKIIQLEKYLEEFIALNKYSLQDEGVSHIILQNSTVRQVDIKEYGLSNWWKLTVNVTLYYRLRYEVVTEV